MYSTVNMYIMLRNIIFHRILLIIIMLADFFIFSKEVLFYNLLSECIVCSYISFIYLIEVNRKSVFSNH